MVDAGLWEEWGRKYGLDKPMPVQYFIFLGKIARGDLDRSFREQRPVIDLIVEKVPEHIAARSLGFLCLKPAGNPVGRVVSRQKGGPFGTTLGVALRCSARPCPRSGSD